VTSPGGSFNLTEAALKQAENELNAAAAAVQRQFTLLEQAVLDNPSKGDAFTAAQRVAGDLRNRRRSSSNSPSSSPATSESA
jgi:Tfp pilus assembly protein PilX